VNEQLVRMGGDGGVIALGRDGRVAMPYNSKGMLRGSIDHAGRVFTAIL
jgi:beta-aspartyl-peptidase (threonine type)